jgi:hypothetical protein
MSARVLSFHDESGEFITFGQWNFSDLPSAGEVLMWSIFLPSRPEIDTWRVANIVYEQGPNHRTHVVVEPMEQRIDT